MVTKYEVVHVWDLALFDFLKKDLNKYFPSIKYVIYKIVLPLNIVIVHQENVTH